MRPKHFAPTVAALALFAAACGDDTDSTADDTDATTEAPATTSAPATSAPGTSAPATDEPSTEPVTGPATITADDQSGDGTSVMVASVSLPTDGFVVVHADGGGSPGPILGWSELLPAGDNTDVAVELQEPLTESATVFPMAHVDANANGQYEFMPPDVTIDVPATTADGAVAVLPISYEVESSGDEGAAGAAASEAGLQLATTDLGEILVDDGGFTLYLFTPDEQSGESTCYDECEANWPVVAEVTSVGEGLDESLLGSTTRTNGDVQATYNDWPLYYFAGDAAPGDVNGQSLNGVWWVVDAAGAAIGM